jgi:hypothetical protein
VQYGLSRNWKLFSGVTLSYVVPNFIQINQEIYKVRVEIHGLPKVQIKIYCAGFHETSLTRTTFYKNPYTELREHPINVCVCMCACVCVHTYIYIHIIFKNQQMHTCSELTSKSVSHDVKSNVNHAERYCSYYCSCKCIIAYTILYMITWVAEHIDGYCIIKCHWKTCVHLLIFKRVHKIVESDY